MSGYTLVRKIHQLEEECDKLGFMMCHSKYHSPSNEYSSAYTDIVAIKPKDQDSMPIYARDSEPFAGTIEELEVWLRGLNWARQYDSLLFGNNHNEKRKRKEQDVRNKQLVKILEKST